MRGRTYRYFNDALFPFGYGLSYTQFELGEAIVERDGEKYTVTVPVKNIGEREGTEIIQLYIRNLSDPDGPSKSLRAFQRVTVKPGQTSNAVLQLTPQSFEFFDPATNTMRTKSGKYELLYGTSSKQQTLKKHDVDY